MEFQPFGRTPDGKRIDDVGGVTMRVHIDLLEEIVTRKRGREAARDAVEQLAQLLNERIPDPTYHVTPAFLKNPWNSYSHEFALHELNFCSMLAEDPDFHLKAGKKLIPKMIQALGRPFSVQQIFKMVAYFGGKYAKALRFEAIQVEEKHAIIRVNYSETPEDNLVNIRRLASKKFVPPSRPLLPLFLKLCMTCSQHGYWTEPVWSMAIRIVNGTLPGNQKKKAALPGG